MFVMLWATVGRGFVPWAVLSESVVRCFAGSVALQAVSTLLCESRTYDSCGFLTKIHNLLPAADAALRQNVTHLPEP